MVQTPTQAHLLYPDSDGKPMADNTVQYGWIVRLVANLKHLFKGQAVFVAGDLLWYPQQVVEPPAPAQAPDVMVVLGRPAGDRGSYKQWEEDNVAPQVVFEILSPSNTAREMLNKQLFYRRHGVLEMFFYDPESYDFWGLVRPDLNHDFSPVTALNFPWISPTLGIRFELFDDGLAVFYPNGESFQDPEVVLAERDRAQQERAQAQQERDRAFAKLRALGIDPTDL
ncbi:MAG: Uma2 family endonuclease [Nodosilinea sp.]